ncbi:acyl-CoA dehydrogenase family protein [Ramlibacter sp. AN1015]|uniref:acyl-CoA dehydrogenase family protein n=1 Tax=Ramlibacter sp. AN1015 TaxID=3133428 RepID=UPI0030C1B6E7
MDFRLSDDEQAFADSVRRFAREQLAPRALERAHASGFPRDVARLMAQQGLLGISFAPEDGGQGGTLMHAVLAIQEVAMACPRSADVVQAGNFGPIRTFVEYASEAQKARYLPGLLSGETVIALGMSEPDAGSAVTELKTRARMEGDAVVLDGTKVFSTHSPDADLFLVYARFGPGLEGIGSVLVERATPGLTVGPPAAFMSGEAWSELHFENCRVHQDNILLGAGGFRRQIAGFNVERLGNAARSLTLGRYCFERAREHAATRRQFGRTLCEFQGIQWKFADMHLKLELAQLALYQAVLSGQGGLPTAQATAVAKLACNQAGWDVANEAMQVMGALGYSRETLVEYCVRRTRGWMIAGGSVEMLKNRIAEGVFGRSFSQRAGA